MTVSADKIVTSMNAAYTLDALLHWPLHQSILLVGDHGTGKDGLVKAAAQMQGIPCLDIRLSQNDIGDLKGMPLRVKGRTVFAPPDWMPLQEEEMELEELMEKVETAACRSAGAERGILYFNELNRAQIEARQWAFEIVLDRTSSTRKIRDGWRIVAAVNGDDHYQVNTLDLALKSRFFIINFKPSVEEWLTWAEDPEVKILEEDPRILDIVRKPVTGPLHPAVVGFIKQHPQMLDPTDKQLEAAEANVCLQVPNRRAWHMLSDNLKIREELANIGCGQPPVSKDQNALNHLLLTGMGYVGLVAGTAFMNYVQSDYDVLSGDIILNKWSDDVAKKVKGCVDRGRVVELSAYSEQIVEIAVKVEGRKFSDAQKRNLTKYFEALSRGPRVHFYKYFLKEAREACNDWYTDKKVVKLVLDALTAPKDEVPENA